eukprot:NODE_440_length_835_cov_4094.597458_g431_i0.p2 GENE.NODE_440_length_835_cov_4094.597458_g431_i0~~NODE_440_length_835_cov_4094.597458_g431_i0.p2  ORF type:complete len:69 (+),score=6.35 NODE_440_length_835_cov_4094.597458_g431_i0:382-588(+)
MLKDCFHQGQPNNRSATHCTEPSLSHFKPLFCKPVVSQQHQSSFPIFPQRKERKEVDEFEAQLKFTKW